MVIYTIIPKLPNIFNFLTCIEITHSKNESLLIVFILSTQSVLTMQFHNPEFQPPVTSGSRVTGCTNFVNLQKSANFT